jgi:small-conductance mechanosensitive channel
VTTVRTASGEVVITPNGQISQVTNLSRDWARARRRTVSSLG